MKEFSTGKSLRPLMIAGMLCLSASAFAQPLSGDYTIDPGMPQGGNNFVSFADAVSALTSNGIDGAVIFEVAQGTFNEQVIIPEISGASASETITFNGNESTILFNSTDPSERAVVKLLGADYITLRNLAIKSTGTTASDYAYGIQLMSGADHNHIVQCSVSVGEVFTATPASNFAGIVINSRPDFIVTPGDANCNYNIIDSNTVKGGYHGISLVADGNMYQVRGNEISNNTVQDFFNSGIYLNGNDGTIVRNNDISRPTRTSAGLFFGIQLYNISKNVSVTGNRIHTPFGGSVAYVTSGANGIYLNDASANAGEENIIANNIIYDLKCGSIIRGIWLGNTTVTSIGSSYNKIINNTVSLDDAGFTGFGTTTGIESSASAQNVTIQNNIISVKRVGNSFNSRMGMSIPSTNNTVDHNDIYMAAGSTNYVAKWGSVNCATINDWQTNSGDGTSISEDPQFVNTVMGLLLPTNNALQTGEDINITGIVTDISGMGRNVVPTMGAFEIDGVVLPVNMSPLNGSLNKDNTALLSWNTFTETNNSGFTVQRSNDGKVWANVAFIGSKADEGNSIGLISYTFKDADAVTNNTFYRLLQTDKDGKQIYSNVVALRPSNVKSQPVLTIYPNPSRDVIKLNTGMESSTILQVIITDYTGKVMLRTILTGHHNEINIESLPAGIYAVRCVDGKQALSAGFVKLK